jgi:hypothetical protein
LISCLFSRPFAAGKCQRGKQDGTRESNGHLSPYFSDCSGSICTLHYP